MRIAVVADVHGNGAAFQAVIAAFEPVDEVWCLGDLVGYGPAPDECIDLLQQMAHRCVAGNHDWAAIGRLPLEDFNPAAAAAARWTAGRLSESHRRFLEGLPETAEIGDFTLAHGSPRHPIWEYILTPGAAAASFPYFFTTYGLVGHTHVPALFVEPGGPALAPPEYDSTTALVPSRLILNPGSVGQPRDGFPEARYMFLDTKRLTFEYRHVPYDIERTQAEMAAVGLPPILISRLSHGW